MALEGARAWLLAKTQSFKEAGPHSCGEDTKTRRHASPKRHKQRHKDKRIRIFTESSKDKVAGLRGFRANLGEDTKTGAHLQTLTEAADLGRRHEDAKTQRRASSDHRASETQQGWREDTKARRHKDKRLQSFKASGSQQGFGEDMQTRSHEDTRLQGFGFSGSQQGLGGDAKTRRHEDTHLQGFRSSGSQQGLGEDTKTRRHEDSGLQVFRESARPGQRCEDAKTRRHESSGLQGVRLKT